MSDGKIQGRLEACFVVITFRKIMFSFVQPPSPPLPKPLTFTATPTPEGQDIEFMCGAPFTQPHFSYVVQCTSFFPWDIAHFALLSFRLLNKISFQFIKRKVMIKFLNVCSKLYFYMSHWRENSQQGQIVNLVIANLDCYVHSSIHNKYNWHKWKFNMF